MPRSGPKPAGAARSAEDTLESIQALFPQISGAELSRGLEALPGTGPRGLTETLREVGDERWVASPVEAVPSAAR